MEGENKNKIKEGLVALALGGSLILGINIGQPNCDYVIENQGQEICLTAEQANIIMEQIQAPVGFGGILFEGGIATSSIMQKK